MYHDKQAINLTEKTSGPQEKVREKGRKKEVGTPRQVTAAFSRNSLESAKLPPAYHVPLSEKTTGHLTSALILELAAR